MAKLAATTYVKPVAEEKPNPYIDGVKEYTDRGVDTPFKVTFDPGEYKAEKLLIQKAVNVHGFSAREVETTYNGDDTARVTSKFLVRPLRKRKGEAHAEGDSAEVVEEVAAGE